MEKVALKIQRRRYSKGAVFEVSLSFATEAAEVDRSFFSEDAPAESTPEAQKLAEADATPAAGSLRWRVFETPTEPSSKEATHSAIARHEPTLPAELLFAAAREAILRLLTEPLKDAEVAAALDVSNAQAKVWLSRLVEQGVIEKRRKPVSYVVADNRLL